MKSNDVYEELTEEQFDEKAGKKDACYHKVKSRYKIWPSAYASGALVRCRKVGAKNWGNKSKKKWVAVAEDHLLASVLVGTVCQRKSIWRKKQSTKLNKRLKKMISCCTRKRTWKDVMFLPLAITYTLLGFACLLTLEMGIAYALGFV